jgi:hypothetical protein
MGRREFPSISFCGRTKYSSREQCVGWRMLTVDALCCGCSLQKILERWSAALYEAGWSVLMLMKGTKIPRIEPNTVHLYQHYWLSMHNKLQYTWCGDYCQCVRPAQLPVLTEVRAPSLLKQHPRHVPQRERAGYNRRTLRGFLPGLMRPASATDDSPSSNVEVKNEWSCKSASPIRLHNMNRDNIISLVSTVCPSECLHALVSEPETEVTEILYWANL